MCCPYCKHKETAVKSNPVECDNYEGEISYQTTNQCLDCHKYFYTYTGPSPEIYEMWTVKLSDSLVEKLNAQELEP